MWAGIFAYLLIGAGCILGMSGQVRWTEAAAVIGIASLAVGLTEWNNHTGKFAEAPEATAVLESAAVCFVLGSLGLGGSLGFLAAVPIVLRGGRVRAAALRCAGAVTALVLLTGWAEQPNMIPPIPVFAQAAGAGILVAMVLYESDRRSSSETESTTTTAEIEASSTATSALPPRDSIILLQAREEARKAQTAYSDLERRQRTDRIKAALLDWRLSSSNAPKRLAKALFDALDVGGLALYGVPDSRRGFFCAGREGAGPISTSPLAVVLHASPIVIREQAEQAVRHLPGGDALPSAAALLIHKGRIAGLVALFDERLANLDSCRETIEAASSVIAATMLESRDLEQLASRVEISEATAEFAQRATSTIGADAALAVVSDLVEALGIDGCTVLDLSDEKPKVLAQEGIDPLDLMSFGSMNGAAGWCRAGAREIVVEDARADERFDKSAVLRAGIGSVMAMPLITSGRLTGLLTIWKKEPNGLSLTNLRLMRELAPIAVKRIFGGFASIKAGLVDGTTFWELSQGPGSFVEADLGIAPAEEADELRTARRRMLRAIMTRLPEGGMVTRRSGGTLLVFLPGVEEDRAARWAQALHPYVDRQFRMSVKGLQSAEPQSKAA